jgi:cell division septal protein FtsQ
MKKWLTDRLKSRKKNRYQLDSSGVETGRASFSFNDRDRKQHRNLLKKLNRYWGAGKDRAQTSYQAENQPGVRRKALLAFCLACAALLFFNSGGFSLFSVLLEDIDYFRITQIRVQGAVNSAADEIRSASGVKVSSSLFAVDARTIDTNIRRENMWVEQVTVSRQWPDTLILQVKEYKPYAMIAVGDDERAQLYYLDKNGSPFIKTGFGMDLDYPVITGLEGADDLKALPEQIKSPLDLLRLAGTNNPNLPVQSISELHVDELEGLILFLVEHPFPIFMGDGDMRKKYLRLRKVMEMLYKPKRTGMDIGRVAYIKMDYLEDKVIVGYGESG